MPPKALRQLARCDRAGPENARDGRGQVDHRRFQADGGRAAVDDQVDATVKIGQHMERAGR